ncbi:aminotransferase class V-fold PLP-dependent enzyme [Mesorhizobium caraganae]|uniref:aminotransferase class V-fold PLP-dependent enzyme n=1 Tax=Mesorhizobium caraganae TaxID=483206 RepID=UPI001FEDBEE7|nr:aminotransferase class V-fold PLP-dependent enzyme [Mesorhizobium caraganae]
MAAFTVAFIRLVLRPFAQDELMSMWKIGRDVGNMYHWNGRLLPVEDLCALAREHDIIPVVDGAQTFAQMPLSFRKLDCDIFVTSLHKWLGAPVGNGMLGRKKKELTCGLSRVFCKLG